MTWSNSILFYFVTISSFLGGKSESILVRIPPNPDQRQSDTYWRFSVYKVENFFNWRVSELEQVSINQLVKAFISGSISSQLTKKSLLASKPVLPMQTYGNEKEDPLLGADPVTFQNPISLVDIKPPLNNEPY
jgi:hypothetical protein